MHRASRLTGARLPVALIVAIAMFAMIACSPVAPNASRGAVSYSSAAESEQAVRQIIRNESSTWNAGDAVGYSRDFASDGIFTNIRGEAFTGYDAFLRQHDVIFKGVFKGTTVQQDIVVLRFVEPNVALVETLTSVSGMSGSPPPGATLDAKGRLRTRLLQVIAKRGAEWKIVAYHNVDVKRGVPVPEPVSDDR